MRPRISVVAQDLLLAVAGFLFFLYDRVDLLASELGPVALVLVGGVAVTTVLWQYRSDRDAHGERVVALQDRPLAVLAILVAMTLPLVGLAAWRLRLGAAVAFAVLGGLALGLGANRVAFGVLRPVPDGALPSDAESTE